jgi:hypothetical protein
MLSQPRSTEPFVNADGYAATRGKRLGGAILQPISRSDFDAMARQDPYFRGRWIYYEEIIELVESLSPPPQSCLEIGAYRLPLFRDSDTLDFKEHRPGLTYLHDAREVPWPVDREYDLAIALQVWEHLGDRQVEAFSELRRVASRAIMSFPLEWHRPDNPTHHGITEERISTWVHGLTPIVRRIAGSETSRRLIYLLELNPVSAESR